MKFIYLRAYKHTSSLMRFELMEIVAMLKTILLLLFFLITVLVCNSGAQSIGCLGTEREALIDFKDGLEDPENWLSSWKGSNCCPNGGG